MDNQVESGMESHYNPSQQTVIVIQQNQKSKLAAFLLTLFFGPLGLLYSTIEGGITMLFLAIISIALFIGTIMSGNSFYETFNISKTSLPIFIIWIVTLKIIEIAWAMNAIDSYNKKIVEAQQLPIIKSSSLDQTSSIPLTTTIQQEDQKMQELAHNLKDANINNIEQIILSHQNKLNHLKELKKLFDKGVLTKEEFDQQKFTILD